MKKLYSHNLVKSALIILVLIIPSSSQARRIKSIYPITFYEVVGTTLGTFKEDYRYTFPFPVVVSPHHVSCYLWLKERGIQGLPLIYFDAHHDLFGNKDVPQSSNWVRFVLEENISPQAFWIVPPWLVKEREDFESLFPRIFPRGINLRLVEDLQELPSGSELGEVILSIDCDYFSSYDPFHWAYREEIRKEIERIVETLADKGIKIKMLHIAVSPGFTTREWENFIKEELLKAFSQ